MSVGRKITQADMGRTGILILVFLIKVRTKLCYMNVIRKIDVGHCHSKP